MEMQTIYSNSKVCAVIVSYNGETIILGTIRALKEQVGHIVIVDNNSNENTIKILKEIDYDNVSVIYNECNKGIAYALNQGIHFAKKKDYTWLLTMDQDSCADENMVGELLYCAARFSSDVMTVSFSPRVIETRFVPNFVQNNNDKIIIEDRYTVITSGNLIRLDVFNIIGEYNELLFIDSVDFDICLRLRMHGYKIIRTTGARLYHSLGQVEGSSILSVQRKIITHSPFRKYYMLRNHIYITRKYYAIFPIYCTWKQIGMIKIILQALFLENRKIENLRYLFKGLCDGITNKLGPTSAE